ncbi:MAG: hypothetical protein U5N86_01620 [Planctomycetota bacterium]|nr:hypothetical protein [Planctomycetota bacterium]
MPACIGMVMPLSKLRNDTVEAVFNFSDVSGAVIFNRSDSIPWYPQVISDIEQGAYRPSPGEIKALINRTRDATTGQFFDDVFSQDFCGFYQELGESGLGFVASAHAKG